MFGLTKYGNDYQFEHKSRLAIEATFSSLVNQHHNGISKKKEKSRINKINTKEFKKIV